jgi:amidohydrolase
MTRMEPSLIRAAISRELPDLIRIRHDLHAHPELAYQEQYTSQVVARELARLGIEHRTGLAGGTGVAAFLPPTEGGDESSTTIALRADMDALPITEETGLPYASKSAGLMHACGHDGHTTILLGAARVLSKMSRPRGVTFVFQPAEEGGAGGKRMCEDGVLDGTVVGPRVSRMYGLHGWPQLPVGVVATRPGPLLAATDAIDAVIHGTQAHAAYPHLGADPIVAAAQCIVGLQTVASRNVSPLDSVVVTIGAVHAGTARNIIPQSATITGTIRTLRAETRVLARARVREIIEQTCAAMGCRVDLRIEEGYPATNNHPEATERFFSVANRAFGESRVGVVPEPTMGGEDFAFYGLRVPACFFVLGVRPPHLETYPQLHQPTFDFNDEALGMGIEAMCELALRG